MIRSDLSKFFKERGYKVGAEIGVYKGEFTELFCQEGLNIFAIDPWTVYYLEPKQKRHDALYEHTKLRLAKYSNCTIIRKSSMEALSDFEDGSLDFVYIDGDHSYKTCMEDITEWSKKVKKGGVVSGHDYSGASSAEVKLAVDDYVKANNIKLELTIPNRRTRDRGNKETSFLWIKQ